MNRTSKGLNLVYFRRDRKPWGSLSIALRAIVYGFLMVLSLTQIVWADVGGTPQTIYQQFQVFGGAEITGNTLMGASASSPLVNSRLLPSSPGDINNIPFDATVTGAFLFWSGSTLNIPDQNVDFTLPDGTITNDVNAERCLRLNTFGGFFACRADVTQIISDHPGVQNYNGRYQVGDLSAEPGTLNQDGSCVEPRECQAKYAAWSLVIVYTSPTSSTLRDVVIYDGFRSFDETSSSPGIAQYSIGGFDFPANGRASLAYLGMEGDALLGVPPQDTDPNQQLRCATCFDFFEVNGQKLNDANNPPNNVFNSSSEIGYTLGVDLDRFDISSLLSPGDSVINLRVGSGDGFVNPVAPDPGGGGELFLLSYIVLNVDRNAPNFNREGTEFTVIPDEAAPLERVVFTLRIQNQGSLTATAVNAQVNLPVGLTYFAGSLRIDGLDPIPGQEQQNPLEMGYGLGQIPFQGDNDRVITFRASIDQGVNAGTQLVSQATINASNIAESTRLTAIVNVLGVPPLGQSTKVVIDGDGDDLFSPDEIIQYRINIPNPNNRPISGVRLIDQLPPYLDLFQVISGGGDDRSDPSLNRVVLENLNIDANASIDIIIIAKIHDSDQLEADGVSPSEIDGLLIANQAQISLGAEVTLSDDPSTNARPDETIFSLDAGIDIRGNGTRKEVSDLNGGIVEPGDLLQYSIRIRNTGASGGQVDLTDRLPIHLDDCQIQNAPAGIVCQNIGGRWQINGLINLLADDTIRVTFNARIKEDVVDQTAIVNEATVRVVNDDTQVVTIRSPQLVVTSAPSLLLDKRSIDGNTVVAGGTIRYELVIRNTGNIAANEVVLIDPISFSVNSVQASLGGIWTPANGGDGGRAQWIIPSLAAGAEQRVTLEVELADSINGGALLSNQASLSYEGFVGQIQSDDPDTSAQIDPTVISVVGQGPLLSLTKSVTPSSAVNGQTVRFDLALRNVGDAAITNANVLDLLPPTLINPSVQNGVTINGGVRFDQNTVPELGVIDPGEVVNLSFTATLNGTPGQEVLNQANASANGGLTALSDDPNTAEPLDPTRVVIDQFPELLLIKSVEDLNGGDFEPGDMVRYTLTTEYSSGVSAEGVVLQDPIPLGLTNISPLDGGALLGGRAQWRLPDLGPARPSVSVRFEAMISPQAEDGQRISNQASLSALNLPERILSDDLNTTDPNDPTTIIVQSRAKLSIAFKQVQPSSAIPGAEILWTIEVENEGPSIARSVIITDSISRWLTDVEAVGGTLSGGQAQWNVGDLGVNQRRRFTLRTRLSEQVTEDDIVANQAIIRGDNLLETFTDDPSTPVEGDPTQLSVLPRPTLLFTKSVIRARAVVSPGEQFRYQLIVQNTGLTALNNVLITDQLPPQLRPITAEGGQLAGRVATWVIPALLPNAQRVFNLEVTLSPSATVGDIINNQAILASSDGVNQVSDDPSTSTPLDPTAIRVVGQSDLQLTKRVIALDQPPFLAGGRVRYELELIQSGDAEATEINILDPMPIELGQLNSEEGVINGQSITWQIPSLNIGERRQLSFEAVISEDTSSGSIITNQAELQWAEGGSPVLSDNPDTPQIDPTQFEVQSRTRLTFTKTVRREDGLSAFTPGSNIIYDLLIINDGPGDSQALSVRDILSPSLIPITDREWVSPDGLVANIQGQEVTWTVPAIAEGRQLRLQVGAQLSNTLTAGFVVLNQAEASLTNQPSITPQLSDDPNTPALSDPTALTVSLSSQVIVNKEIIDSESIFAPGGTVTYLLTVINQGDGIVDRLALSDQIPSNMTFVSSNPPSVISANDVVSWSRFNLQVNEERRFELSLRINDNVPQGTTLSNQARLSPNLSPPVLSDDPNTPIPSDPTSFNVLSTARLFLVKRIRDVNGGQLKPGELVEFTLTISNIGTEIARDIEVIDPLSSLLVDVNPIGGTVSDQIARWRILQLQPDASRTFTLNARVREDAQAGDLLTNQFAARETGDTFTLSPEVSLNIEVDQFNFTKRARPILTEGFVPGGGIEYIISITNTGSSVLQSVIVSDPLPIDLLEDIRINDGGVLTGAEVTWDSSNPALESIAPGQTVTLSIRAQINAQARVGQELLNQAFMRLSAGEPSSPLYQSDDPETPAIGDPTRLLISAGAALNFTKDLLSPSNRQQINPGDEITYLIRIENIGQRASALLTIGDVPDVALRLLRVEVNGVSRDTLSLIRGTLSIESVQPGQTVDVLVTCQVSPQAEQSSIVLNQATLNFDSNNGTISSVSDDPVTLEPDDPTAFTIGGSVELSMIKTARVETGEPFARSEELIEWVVQVRNQGTGQALQLDFTDEIPNEVSYVANSLKLNGLLLTDAVDLDPGQFVPNRNRIEMTINQIESNEIAEISFQTRVNPIVPNGAQQTENQALLLAGERLILSDQDTDPNNGLNPTVVQLQAPLVKTYFATLNLVDVNGPPAQINEQVSAEIVLKNTGTTMIESLEFSLPIPAGLIYNGATLVETQGELRYEPANRQEGQPSPDPLGTLYLRDLSLDPGSQVIIQVALTVDPDLVESKALCLQGQLSDLDFDPDIDQGQGFITTDNACFDGRVVFGRLSGDVFQDLNDNGLFDSELDLALSGMIISIWKADEPEGEAIATDFSDREGGYMLENLRPGRYELRLKSTQGVSFRKSLPVTIIALEEGKQPLEVEPTGRIYDSLSGDLLDGAQLFLYRDEDLSNDDPFDDESRSTRTLVPETVFDSPTQQGQRSAQGGMYRFDVNEPGRYLIEVIPPGVRYVGPSSLIPPLPNFVNASGDEIRLSPLALPSASPEDVRKYTLAFEVTEAQVDTLKIVNNHIPLDPLSSLIQIDKRSRRIQYVIGDIVTYEIDVINRSPADLIYDAVRRAGGVYIEDILPKGLKYIAQSAIWVEVIGAKERPLFSAEPSGNRILRFGRDEEVIDERTDTVRRVQTPLDLKAGAHLRLRYQVVIGPQAKPLRSYTNRARVLADGDIPISAVAKAKIQVVADPDFDQGLLLGRVWCDDDKDGLQDEGERGLVGAKIYFDSGMYAVTDSTGKYHFKLIDPGSHAVKIDQKSLLPGAALTTDELRVIYFTRGLPAKVDFGVTCPKNEVKDSTVELGSKALTEALKKLGSEAVILKGNTQTLTLQLDSLIFNAPPVDVNLSLEGDIPDIIPPPDGAQLDELKFETKLPVGTRVAVKRWTLWVAREGAEEHPVVSGVGSPPDVIQWDGQDQLGVLLARRGRVLSYRFELVTDELIVSSPLHRFGIGVTIPPEPEVLLAFPTSSFDPEEPRQLSEDDRTRLDEVISRLKRGYEGRLLIDVHGSGEEDAAFLTSARAEAIAGSLQKELNLKSDEILSEGSGNQFPLIPNLTQINKRRNRRALIRLEQLTPDENALELLLSPVTTAPIIRAGREERLPTQTGQFIMVADLPTHGIIEVYLRTQNGASVTFSLPLDAAKSINTSPQNPLAATRPISLGGQWGETLSLGGETLSLDLAQYTLSLEESDLEDLKFTVNTVSNDETAPLYEIRSWALVTIEGGDPLEVEMGDGPPPKQLIWSPLDLLNEDSKVGLMLKVEGEILAGGSVINQSGLRGRFTAFSPTLWITGQGDKAKILEQVIHPSTSWRLKLDSEELIGQTGQRAEKVFTLKTGQAIDLTLVRPNESKVITHFVAPRDQIKTKAKQATTNTRPASSPNEEKKTETSSKRKVKRSQIREMSLWLAGGLTRGLGQTYSPLREEQRQTLLVNLQLPSEALIDVNSTPKTPAKQTDSRAKTSTKQIDQGPSASPVPSKKYRNFGAKELMQATLELLKSRAKNVAAQELVVHVPQGEELSDSQVAISGQTKPGNRIYLNGVEVPVNEQGQFVGASLVGDEGLLEVKSIDPDGNIARVQRRYKLSDQAWFLLALGESLTGALGSELDGVQAHTSTKIGDQIYIHGRAVAYLKGRVKGDDILGGLFKKYEITAHLDTAKKQEFQAYFKQVIDPNRYYPVYGDSAQEVMDVNSRGPLYVLVKADRSLIQVGNFRTQLRGLELLNYDRSLYGAQVSLDLSQEGWRHQAQVFGATQDQPERHTYVELRGTGGSLYYLPHRELVEGSERLYIIERDRISNMERRRVSLTRNIDYSIRYQDGRLLMMKPVTSSTMDSFGALPQPTGSQVVLDGHPTFISVEYDHRDAKEQGEDAWGAYMRETWRNKTGKSVAVGGGFIQEQQGDVAQGHYRLWGGHMTYQHARKTGFAVEYAKSLNQNAENLFSQDGGLTFQPFSLRAKGKEASGESFLVKAQVELDDLIGKGDQDWVWLEGYWRYAAPGFYAGGNIQQQGTENYGIKVNYRLSKSHLLVLNYDEMATKQTPFEINPFITDYRRKITRLAHQYSADRLTLETAWTRTENEQGLNSEGVAPPVFSSDVVSIGAQYKLTPKLTLLGEQELVLRGDRRLYEKTSDLFVTSLGARYKLSESLQIEGIQSLRWSGDNATQLGIRSEVEKGRTVYAQQRLIDQLGRRTNSTVIGAEERFAQGARAFSEYQFESGQLGQRNRAVLGIGKRTQLVKGLTIDANYQRSQVINNFSNMQTGSGDLSQDALSFGLEWLAHPKIKLSSRLEVRFDDTDEWQGQRDKNQILALNNLSYQLNRDLTLQLRFNYSITEDEVFKSTEAEFMETSLGIAYRPIKQSWLAILFKATSRFEQRPVDLSVERPEIEEMSVLSLIPIFELPLNFQLVEKIVYKRSALIVENLLPTVSHNVLWINRLNYHLTNEWDIGVEYRILQNTLAQSTLHGALFELNYIIKKSIRVGAGYNFTSFTDDEFARFDEQYGGPFFRVMAQY